MSALHMNIAMDMLFGTGTLMFMVAVSASVPAVGLATDVKHLRPLRLQLSTITLRRRWPQLSSLAVLTQDS
jgi:hypothetical protein